MDVTYPYCAGLDVHKKSVVACRITPHSDGWHEDIRTFGTMTADLLALADWLREAQVTQVAMESTGVYWKPVFNLLETNHLKVARMQPILHERDCATFEGDLY